MTEFNVNFYGTIGGKTVFMPTGYRARDLAHARDIARGRLLSERDIMNESAWLESTGGVDTDFALGDRAEFGDPEVVDHRLWAEVFISDRFEIQETS